MHTIQALTGESLNNTRNERTQSEKKEGNLKQRLKKIGLLALFMALFIGNINATTYTAVVSGNFNAAATWGGTIPTTISSSDIIIIPVGITVGLSANQTFSGTPMLTVNGTLFSSTSALIMTSGSLSGSGTINVDSTVLGLVSGITYTGSITTNKFTSLGANFTTATTLIVNNTLRLLSGTLTISAGSLTMSSGSTIEVSAGNVTVGGTGILNLSNAYNVSYVGSFATIGTELYGSGLNNISINIPGSVTLSSNLNVNGQLALTAGTLMLNNHDLTFGANGNIAAGGSGSINSTMASNITINAINGFSGVLRFATSGNTVNNLTVNTGSSTTNVSLGSDLIVNGTLTLTMGTLTLNNNNMTFSGNANVAAAGTGSISGNTVSNISVISANTFLGALRFSPSSNHINNLIINMSNSSSSFSIGTNLTIHGQLNLQSGKVNIFSNNLTIAVGGTINAGSTSSYVITNGIGVLVMNLPASTTAYFQVGTVLHYAPMAITANSTSATGDVSVSVMDMVYHDGTSGSVLSATKPLVSATWLVNSNATSGINYNMQAMWSGNMEVNSFNRSKAFISHYTVGGWDMYTPASASMAGSMYSITRNGITSLSPFTVADNNSNITGVEEVDIANNTLVVYPNPTIDILNFKSDTKIDKIELYDEIGHLVKSEMIDNGNSLSIRELPIGNYNMVFYGSDFKSVHKIVKQ